MNEKKLYKVTITDENGKVVHEVESEGSRGGAFDLFNEILKRR